MSAKRKIDPRKGERFQQVNPYAALLADTGRPRPPWMDDPGARRAMIASNLAARATMRAAEAKAKGL